MLKAFFRGLARGVTGAVESSARTSTRPLQAGYAAEMRQAAVRKLYQVGLVGESNYQPAIRRCSPRQAVMLLAEPDNPYDPYAIAVCSVAGETIGYIARDHWLKRALLEEGKGCSASIRSIGSGGKGLLGVVLDVRLEGDEVGERGFVGR